MMVVRVAMRAWTRGGEAPVTEVPAPPEAADASESSRADPRRVDQPLARQETYVKVDALKKFMSNMTGATMQQVLEQVKKAVEAASSASLSPTLDICLPQATSPPIGTISRCPPTTMK